MDYLTLQPSQQNQDQLDEIQEWDSELNLEDIDPLHPVHMEIIHDMQDILEDGFSSFLDNFITSSEALFQDIKSAFHNKEYEDLRDIAHRLKGSSAQLGIYYVSAICVRIEILSHHNNHDYLMHLIPILEDDLKRGIAALQNIS